jgi:hypothetical protein
MIIRVILEHDVLSGGHHEAHSQRKKNCCLEIEGHSPLEMMSAEIKLTLKYWTIMAVTI